MTEIIQCSLSDLKALVKDCVEAVISGHQTIESQQEPGDWIGLEDALHYIKEATGKDRSKSWCYKMTSTNRIPHSTFNGQLVFSRKGLETWIADNLKRKDPGSEAVERLKEAANKKETY